MQSKLTAPAKYIRATKELEFSLRNNLISTNKVDSSTFSEFSLFFQIVRHRITKENGDVTFPSSRTVNFLNLKYSAFNFMTFLLSYDDSVEISVSALRKYFYSYLLLTFSFTNF